MRTLSGFLCVFALAVVPLVGCGATGDGDGGVDGGVDGGDGGTDGGDLCEGVECTGDDNECTADACDPATGMCYPPIEDGTDCDFGDLPGLCMSGVCKDAMLCQDVDCDDDNECTDDVCDPADGTCDFTPVADNTDCDFGDLPGLCMSGACEGLCQVVECDDDNECTDDTCDPGDGTCDNSVVADNTDCDFDDLPGLCAEGVCQGLCEGVSCEDTECKIDGICDASDGTCGYTLIADGTTCTDGECLDGVCAPIGAFPCTEQGIRDAIAEGGGPHFFACDGPTTVVTDAEIVIDNDVILDGEGKLTVDGNESHVVFSVPEGVTAELDGFTVTRGRAASIGRVEGGGIQNSGTLTLMNSTVSDNRADSASNFGNGGGISNSGTLTLTNSTVSGNTANTTGFAPTGNGGGISNFGGTLTLTNSAVSDNGAAFFGGGIFNSGGTVTLTNSTVSGNSSNFFDEGGISNAQGGTVTLTNSTISGNEGGISNAQGGTVTLLYSTVSGNTAGSGISNAGTMTLTACLVDGECATSFPFVVLTSNGYNIESPGDTCGFDQLTDQPNVSPEDLDLQPLASNGGPTMTHAITPDSAAFDRIPPEDCEVDTDQRGVSRPQFDACDVGAFEHTFPPCFDCGPGQR